MLKYAIKRMLFTLYKWRSCSQRYLY